MGTPSVNLDAEVDQAWQQVLPAFLEALTERIVVPAGADEVRLSWVLEQNGVLTIKRSDLPQARVVTR